MSEHCLEILDGLRSDKFREHEDHETLTCCWIQSPPVILLVKTQSIALLFEGADVSQTAINSRIRRETLKSAHVQDLQEFALLAAVCMGRHQRLQQYRGPLMQN
jgi:hypothetical protein